MTPINNAFDFFLNSVRNFPYHIALKDSKNTFSYMQTLVLASKISNYLINKNIFRKPVMVEVENNCSSLIAFLGILMSGNYYCPCSKDFGSERIASIKSQLDASVFFKISDNNIFDLENKQMVLELDDFEISETSLEKFQSLILTSKITSSDPCYIIFTSGSTGLPKGVVVSHMGVIDYILWAKKTYNFNDRDIFGSQAPLIFDNSTLDIYGALSSGATLNFIPRSLFSFPVKLRDYLIDENITVIFWVPSVLTFFQKYKVLQNSNITSLRMCLFAGEVMPANTLKYWMQNCPDALFSNLYGPTEITVDCTYFIVPEQFDLEEVPIGVECENSNIFVLNSDKEISNIGELYVKGPGVALGYWNDPERTAKAFVQNPLHNNFRDICYKTGDIVEKKDDLIFFRGRADTQIKFQGYRIELGEIESTAQLLDGVTFCVAGFDEVKNIIWLIYSGSEKRESLLNFLTLKLASYSLPRKIYNVDVVPLLPNGKINRSEINKIYNELV